MTVVQETIEHGGNGRGVPEQSPPVIDGPVRGDEGAGAFVASHDEFEEIFGCRVRQFAHAEIIDDQQGHRGGVKPILS